MHDSSPSILMRFQAVGLCVLLLTLLTACAPTVVSLPNYQSVPEGEMLPVDGSWRLAANNKEYRIERGRMWIEEDVTVLALRYVPGQVVVQSIRQTGPRTYEGWDIALGGKWSATFNGEDVTVRTASTIAFASKMTPVALEYADWYEAQSAADEVLPPPRALWPDGADSGVIAALDLPGPDVLGSYHALVVGNAAYEFLTPLETAENDAVSVARVLRADYGFAVKLLRNATRAETLAALREYRETLGVHDNLMIYYAGHGWLDTGADEGYWLPVNAKQDSDVEWISNSTITNYLKSINAKHILIVADSCYSGTLTRGVSLQVRAPGYLTKMAQARARIVLSSGGLEPVSDVGGGGHSAFAKAFLDALDANESVVDSTTLYAEIRRPVMLAADQSPELADIRKAGYEGGDFLFVKPQANPAK